MKVIYKCLLCKTEEKMTFENESESVDECDCIECDGVMQKIEKLENE